MAEETWPGEMRIFVPSGMGLTRLGEYAVPPTVTVFYDGERDVVDGQGWPDLQLRYEVRGGVIDCVEMRVASGANARAVRLSDLAVSFDLDRIATDVFLRLAVRPDEQGGGRLSTDERLPARRSELGERTGTRVSELDAVARIFLAPDSRRKPTQSVADALGYTLRTASRRVDDARQAGLLPPAGATDAELDAAREALDARIDALSGEHLDSQQLDNMLKYEAHKRRQAAREAKRND